MRILFCLVAFFTVPVLHAQIVNGSFENGSNADLTGWEWTCMAQSHNDGPAGGGDWSIKVWGGNTQGCFPGYSYQKLPGVTSSQAYVLSGWAYAETAPPVGIYFGKINNGVISLQAGDTTSSTSWKQLTVLSSFSLSASDTAVVVLYGGQAGGPVQGFGYFDLIDLQPVTGLISMDMNSFINIFPNPFNEKAILQTNYSLHNATLTINNIFGQTIKQLESINGRTVTLHRTDLPGGLYFVHLIQDNKIIATKKIMITD